MNPILIQYQISAYQGIKGYGLENHLHGIPNTPQTRFNLGSITMQFTARVLNKIKMLDGHTCIQLMLVEKLSKGFKDERHTLCHRYR